MSTPSAVTIVTVAFNSAGIIADLMASIPDGTPVIIVDNASADDIAECAARWPKSELVRLDRNLGFGTACNVGARKAATEFVLFLNPDARLQPDTIAQLLAAARHYPSKSVFNPRLLDDGGQITMRAPSRFLGRARGARAPNPTHDIPIDVLTGAAIFMRRADFVEAGGFDENIFLYFEDDDFSLRLLGQGFQLHHVHDAIVYHHGGRATPASPALTQFKNYHWMKSYRYVARKHGAPLARMPLLAMSGFRWLMSTATRNGAERDKYWGRLRAIIEP